MKLAYAHGDLPPAPHDLWSAWVLDPYVLVPLALAAFAYGRGIHALWRRAGIGRGVGRWEAGAFAGGMAALFFSLVWPLDALGEVMFSAHMAQHLVLMNVAAPLLVLGSPMQAMFRALPRAGRRAIGALVQTRSWRTGWRWLTGAAVATVLQQITMWGWHTPRGVAVALESEPVHIAMHASLLVAALLFWTAVLRPTGGRYWAPLAALAATLKVSGAICIVLLVLPTVRFAAYGDSAAAWGLSPLEDEQIGWGIMMVFGSLTYLGAAIALFALWFQRLPQSPPAMSAPVPKASRAPLPRAIAADPSPEPPA